MKKSHQIENLNISTFILKLSRLLEVNILTFRILESETSSLGAQREML
jgi:hypothetical protein